MMMMNEERKELLEYLKVLTDLNNGKFRCEKEIKDVMDALHNKGYNFDNEETERLKRFEEIEKKLKLEIAFSGNKQKPMYGKLIRVTEKERGLGKTTLLIHASLKYDIPIVVGKKHLIDVVKRKAKELYGEQTEISVLLASEDQLAGRKLPNGVLIDCQITLFDYMVVKKWCLIRGGFYHDREFI
ncbi:hypothetical protein [Bacillus phage vB_BanS-Thrax5]|nr:hypothetical protein [Bacillus phage vB_BanS-Thrax5]